MANEIKPTPEEQLLRLIEGPGSQETLVPGGETETETGKPRFGLGLRLRNAFSAMVRGGLSLKTLNRFLVLITVGLVIYLAWEFAATQPTYDDTSLTARPAGEIKEIPEKHGWDYTDVVSARNPFKPVEEKKVEPPPVVQPPTTTTQPLVELPPRVSKLAEIINSLKLKGVSWEPAPAIAIIEDSKKNTYVVIQGKLFDIVVTTGEKAEIKIKKISRDRVVLSYKNEEQELTLME